MIVGIQATRNFDNYAVFLRGISVALSDMKDEDKSITIFSAGPVNLNSMALEFSNKTEDSLKARGIKIKTVKVPSRWFEENMHTLDYFAYFSLPKEPVTPLIKEANDHDVENGIFRY
jgi:hypothetical protein